MEACWRRLVLLDGELRWCARRCAQMCGVCARVCLCARFRACVQSLAGREPCRAKLDLLCAVLLLASEDVVCVVRAGASDTSLRSSQARVRLRL